MLTLRQLQAPQLAYSELAGHLLPSIERLLRDFHPADDLSHRRTRLRLPRRERNLLLGVLRHLHVPAPRL